MRGSRTHKGIYRPKNPHKYMGDVNNIVFRSSWERTVFRWADLNTGVSAWSSEELIIPYYDESTNKQRRYFPDLIIVNNKGDKFVVEVKPYDQTVPPKPPKTNRKTTQERYLNETLEYSKNISKWKAAESWCEKRGFKFIILTEKEIFGNKK